MQDERPGKALGTPSIDDELVEEDLADDLVEDSDELPEEEEDELDHPDEPDNLTDDDHEYSRP